METALNDRKAAEVVPGLYLGSIASMIFSEELDSIGITHVLTVAKGIRPFHVISQRQKFQNVEYLIVPIEDYETENISKYFDDSCKYIKEAIDKEGKVLVHW